MENKVKILIADDHPLFRKGLKNLLEETPGDFFVAEADNGAQALEMMKKQAFDVAIFDIDMPFLNGLDAARECKNLKMDTKIIILTMYKDEHLFNRAVDIGVMGYVLKENAVAEIKNTIQTVLNGQHYICPAISGFLLNRERNIRKKQEEEVKIRMLTATEKNILKLISESKTSKEIARQMHVSVKTIEKHRLNICNKLNIHGTHALIKYAFEHRSEL